MSRNDSATFICLVSNDWNLELGSWISPLTDVGAMTRLLHECIAYKRGLDLELESLLSHRSDLDKQLNHLQKSAEVLGVVKSESDHVLSNVRSTCDLADQVSGKVRELDLAQSRVNETLLRIDAIVESRWWWGWMGRRGGRGLPCGLCLD